FVTFESDVRTAAAARAQRLLGVSPGPIAAIQPGAGAPGEGRASRALALRAPGTSASRRRARPSRTPSDLRPGTRRLRRARRAADFGRTGFAGSARRAGGFAAFLAFVRR